MRAVFHIFLIIWLVLSIGFWVFAIGYGNPVVPPINAGTIMVIYAPWMILLAMVVRDFWKRQKKTTE